MSLRRRLEDLERRLSPSSGAQALKLLCDATQGLPGARERLQMALEAGTRWDGHLADVAAVFLAAPVESTNGLQETIQ